MGLAPVTTRGLDEALENLAAFGTKLTPAVEDLLRRAASDKDVARMGVVYATHYGATSMLKILTQGWDKNTLHPRGANQLLEKALMSDCADTVDTIKAFVPRVSSENIVLALTRERADVVKILDLGQDERSIEAGKKRLKAEIVNKTASIGDRMPKSVEFAYDDEMTKLRPLLSQPTVRYEDLLRALHIPPVHAEKECPGDCRQREDCDRLRQVYFLVRLLVAKMGEINPVFRLGANRHPSIIGSMKEHTRAFFNNEVDVHISLNRVLKNWFYFDQDNQQLRASQNLEGEHIGRYVSKERVFDCKKFSLDFMECLESALCKVDLSQGFRIGDKHNKFTMEPPTTSYEPCLRCMLTTETGRPQAQRCRHRPDCEPHRDGVAECLNGCTYRCESFSHERTCNCQEYTSPSLTITKIGVALHVKFLNRDGCCTFIDCDITIPTIPTCTRYDGRFDAARDYLTIARPVGWLQEFSKLDDMRSAQNSPDYFGAESWQVKMRMINRDLVLPRQSLLFLNDSTLRGLKLSVYVLIKILKYSTGSSAKSYQCKFTINDVLQNRDVSEREELSKVIQEVIHFYTLRGKFSSIHPELGREGIIRVEVGKEGLHFIRDSGEAEESVRESTIYLVGTKDEKEEEELLRQAIALSEENENDIDEEELLRQAIALSLE